jgi:hypothetical protein
MLGKHLGNCGWILGIKSTALWLADATAAMDQSCWIGL